MKRRGIGRGAAVCGRWPWRAAGSREDRDEDNGTGCSCGSGEWFGGTAFNGAGRFRASFDLSLVNDFDGGA